MIFAPSPDTAKTRASDGQRVEYDYRRRKARSTIVPDMNVIENARSPMRPSPQEAPLILHVRTMKGFGGGPEKTILNSPRFLRRLGYRSVLAYTHPPGDPGFARLAERAAAAEAPLVSVPDRGPFDWRVVTRLIALCRERRVAIWHGHDYKSNVIGLIARQFWPMKLATTVHGWGHEFERTPFYYRIDKFCLRYYDEVICVARNLYQECLKYGVSRDRCHVILNAIDTEQFSRAAVEKLNGNSLGPRPAGTLLAAMGRLEDEKGFDLLIAATDRLIRDGRDVSLWIAGVGAAQHELEKRIRQTAQPDRIRLVGLADPREFLRAADLFVLSSRREGLPNVVLEAMALEVPLITTPVGGVRELVRDGVNGLIVPIDDLDALVRGITRLLDDRPLGRALAQSARQTIERSFSFQRRMEKVAVVYDQLLRRPAASSSTPQCAST